MKINAIQNQNFKSTKIPITNNKREFMSYIEVLPPKYIKLYSQMPIADCLTNLKTYDSAIGLLLGKDKCFYIFGKTQNQDKFLYNRLKKIDKSVQYIKDVKD